MDVILSGRFLSAREALDGGLVARVVAQEAWLDEAKRVAREIAAKSPVALRLAKEAVEPRVRGPAAARHRVRAAAFYLALSSEDATRGPQRVRREAEAGVPGPLGRELDGDGVERQRFALADDVEPHGRFDPVGRHQALEVVDGRDGRAVDGDDEVLRPHAGARRRPVRDDLDDLDRRLAAERPRDARRQRPRRRPRRRGTRVGSARRS